MARGKYEDRGNGPRGPVLAILLLAAVAAVVVAGTAFLNALNGELTLPSGPSSPTEPPKAESAEILQQRAELLVQAQDLIDRYFYEEAIALLDGCGALQNNETGALRYEAAHAQELLVPYTGPVYHLFFRGLVNDPERAFDGDAKAANYDRERVTVQEFSAILPLLEQNGFLLYDIAELAEPVDGVLQRKPILLPAGKKPLVLSLDAVNYYDSARADGFPERLDVDGEGRIVTIVDGEATSNGDAVPILDAYVREHPGFSWRGAKGVVGLTGYAGAFGYRITDLADYDAHTQSWMLERVQAVAAALREGGWRIASNSYTHNLYWSDKSITMEQLEYDTGRWKNEIAPYVGETNLFLAPYGVSFSEKDPRFRYLVEQGFTVFCPMDAAMPLWVRGDHLIQGRCAVDGNTLRFRPERLQAFFDPASVLDPARPNVQQLSPTP